MTLRFLEPSPEDRDAALAGMYALSRSGAISSPRLRRVATETLQLSRPLPVYTFGLDELRDTIPLSAARQTGWRYFVEADGQVLALAETIADVSGRQAFASLNYGTFVNGTDETLRQAMQMEGDFVVRLLNIPGVYLLALWLDPEGAPAVLVPIAPAPPGIDANRRYEAQDLFNLVRTRAVQFPPLPANDDRGT
jgi:hypothetical protein